jgi:hypothetical protein
MDSSFERILGEADRATTSEAHAYLLGAAHDGTFNRQHRTWRIAQADRNWLEVLGVLFGKCGSRSWIYREGSRDVWVIETTCRLSEQRSLGNVDEEAAFARGYFDAEGGIPRNSTSRLYLQFVQKDLADLTRVRECLIRLGLTCGAIHNPSVRADPDYWRFYVLSESHEDFLARIGSWHPRKRRLIEERLARVGV